MEFKMRYLVVVVTVAIVVAFSCGTRKETPKLSAPPPPFAINGPTTGDTNTPLKYTGSYCSGDITWEVSGEDKIDAGDEATFTFDTVGTYLITATCKGEIISNQAISTTIAGGKNPVPVPEDPKPDPDPNKPNPVPTPAPIPNPIPIPTYPYPTPNPIPNPKDPTQSEPPCWGKWCP